MYNRDIPSHTKESLINYFDRCWEPGGFLMAVLRNDLYAAATKADHVNGPELANIVKWIINNAPYGSYGDKEAVNGWLNKNRYQQAHEKQRVVEILSDKDPKWTETSMN